jgi:predicted Zn-dependent protease
MATTTHEYRLNVNAGGKTYSLDFRQAFHFGYALARTRTFKEAVKVFQALRQSQNADDVATIMLAYCKAGLHNYRECSALLGEVLAHEEKTRLERLHTAFVYLSVGMWDDAIDELTELAREHPSVPVIYLLLGDVLALRGRRVKAILCWRLAAARDRKDGAVAATAKRLLSSQMPPHTTT